jgi:hypothetical protein
VTAGHLTVYLRGAERRVAWGVGEPSHRYQVPGAPGLGWDLEGPVPDPPLSGAEAYDVERRVSQAYLKVAFEAERDRALKS